MAYKSGAAYISVSPDFRGWHAKSDAFLKSQEPEFEKAGEKAGAKFMRGFKDRVRAGDMPKATIKATADTARARAELDKAAKTRDAKIRVHTEWLKSPWTLGALGATALGPQALGLGIGAAGAGVAFGAAAASVAAFGAIAVPMLTKVKTAQQALTKAQQAYATATTKAQRASALHAEAKALASLTPAERSFARELGGVESAWHRVQRAEEPVVARSLAPWLGTARYGLRFLGPAVTDAGNAIRFLGQKAEAALKAPFWGKFFTTLRQTGSVALLGFGDALGHVGSAFAHLFVTFAPDIQKLPGLVDRWAASFDRWAGSYKRSGVDAFMRKTFSRGNVATLKGDLSALGTTLSNVAKATANLSPAAFLGLSKVLEILSKLSPGQIEAIGALYAVGRLAGGGRGLASILGGVLGKGGGRAAEGAAAAEGGSFFKKLMPAAGLNLGTAAAAAFLIGISKIHNRDGSSWLTEGPGGKGGGWNNFGQAGKNLKNWLVTDPSNWLSFGKNDGDSFVQGLVSRLESGVKAKAPALSDSGQVLAQRLLAGYRQSLVKSGPGAGAWLAQTGRNAVEGFAAGFKSKTRAITDAVSGAKNSAIRVGVTAPQWLRPSGGRAAQGFALGFTGRRGTIAAAVGGAKTVAQRIGAPSASWLRPAGSRAAAGFAGAITAADSRIAAAVAGIKGVVQNASYGFSSLLAAPGTSMMGGFLGAIQQGERDVHANLQGLTAQIPSWKGPPAKDQTLLTPAGRAIMASLVKGLTSGYASVRSFLAYSSGQIQGAYKRLSAELGQAVKHKVISPGTDSAVTSFLRRDTSRLAKLAARRRQIQNRINAADAYAANVTASAKASYGIIGAAQAAAPPSGGTPTAKAVIGQLRLDANRVRQFGHDIVKLRKMGLNRAYIDQLVQDFTGGDTQAAAIAHEFATGPLSQIRQVNRAEAKIAQGSRYLGNQAANDMYEAAGQAGKGFLAGLERRKAAINRLMRQIADEMVRELKKRLGIHSPATATIAVGEMTGLGVVVGAKRSLARIRQAAGLMTAALMPAAALPGVGSTLAPGALALTVRYDGPTDGVIGALVKDLRYDIQHNAGGDVQKRLGRGKART